MTHLISSRIEQMTVTAFTADEPHLRTTVRVTITRETDGQTPNVDDEGGWRLTVRMSGEKIHDSRTLYSDLEEAKAAAQDWASRLLQAKLATHGPTRDLRALIDGFTGAGPLRETAP
jgi:hypothetical protein